MARLVVLWPAYIGLAYIIERTLEKNNWGVLDWDQEATTFGQNLKVTVCSYDKLILAAATANEHRPVIYNSCRAASPLSSLNLPIRWKLPLRVFMRRQLPTPVRR